MIKRSFAKNFIAFVYFTLLISCNENIKNNPSTSNKSDCENSFVLGEKNLCMPKIDGMNEVISNDLIEENMEFLLPEEVLPLAYYINDDTFNKIDEINDIFYDDYLLVSTMKMLIDRDVSRSVFENLSNINDMPIEAIELSDKMMKEKFSSIPLSFDSPILLKTYSLNENIVSNIILSKILFEDEEIVRILVQSTVYFQGKILSMHYNYDYKGIESLEKAQAKNDFMVLKIFEKNQKVG